MFLEAYSRTFFSFGCSFRRVWPEELPRLFSAQVARLPPNALHSAECIAENLNPNILTISSFKSSLELLKMLLTVTKENIGTLTKQTLWKWGHFERENPILKIQLVL